MLSFPELGFGGNSLLSNARANGNLLGCLGGLQAAYSAQHTKGDCSMAGTRVVLHTPHTAPSLQTPKWKLLCISDTQGTMLLHPMYTLCHWNTHIFLLNNAAGTRNQSFEQQFHKLLETSTQPNSIHSFPKQDLPLLAPSQEHDKSGLTKGLAVRLVLG